jgi:hypothetical protein
LFLATNAFIRVSDLTNTSLTISTRDSVLVLLFKSSDDIEISLISSSIFNGLVYLLGFIFFEYFIPKPVIIAPIVLNKKIYLILPFSLIVGLVRL